jgi:hypothetical protein
MAVAVFHHSGAAWILLIVLVAIFLAINVPVYCMSRKHNLNFDVPVGITELHTVHYFRNAYTGRARISVDGVQILKRLQVLNFSVKTRYEIPVGQTERHMVSFVRTRKWVMAGLRTQTVIVYVDGDDVLTVTTSQSGSS